MPGINFLPVGALPTDIATTPDGRMAFVASAEPNKFAIYGIPTHRILGDIAGRPPDPRRRADARVVAGLRASAASRRAHGRSASAPPRAPGAPIGGPASEAGGPTVGRADYELVVVLPGDRRIRRRSSRSIRVRSSAARLGRRPDGAAVADDFGTGGPVLAPGSLAPCPITSAIELAGRAPLPATFRRAPRGRTA